MTTKEVQPLKVKVKQGTEYTGFILTSLLLSSSSLPRSARYFSAASAADILFGHKKNRSPGLEKRFEPDCRL